jgi:hypothetical protein
MAKNKLIPWLFSVVVVVVAVLAVESTIRNQGERKRQALYQSILSQYSTTLRPGSQRGEVEAVLASQGLAFQQTCCLLRNKQNAPEDIVKIGSEPKPWYCSENDMYLVFEFESPPGPTVREINASDRLRRVALAPWFGNCL